MKHWGFHHRLNLQLYSRLRFDEPMRVQEKRQYSIVDHNLLFVQLLKIFRFSRMMEKVYLNLIHLDQYLLKNDLEMWGTDLFFFLDDINDELKFCTDNVQLDAG